MRVTGGFVVDLKAPELRERLERALAESTPASLRTVAAITDANAPAAAYGGLPVVRAWVRGRTPGTENPFQYPDVRHVLGAAPFRSDELSSTLRHLGGGMPIRLWQLLSAPGTRETFRLESFEQRRALHDQIGVTLARAGISERIGQELVGAADELVANALYDAPVEGGRHLYASVSRRQPVPCPRPIDVEVAADDRSVAILVRDYFGSLAAEAVVANLARCYAFDDTQIDHKEGGAGLGLFMVLVASSRLVVNLVPGRVTEVILTRDVRLRPPEFRATAPTLNICVVEDSMLESRRHQGRPVSLAASSAVDGRLVYAAVRDLSRRGAFLEPLAPVQVTPAQAVTVTLFESSVTLHPATASSGLVWDLAPAFHCYGTVRWVGTSERHHCAGFGVEFDRDIDGLD